METLMHMLESISSIAMSLANIDKDEDVADKAWLLHLDLDQLIKAHKVSA
jgi:hypothetical protein